MFNRFRNIGIAAIAAVVLIAGIGLTRLNTGSPVVHASGAITTDTATVQKGDVLVTVSALGSLQPEQSAALSFTATGKVVSVNVNQGDHVLKGQTIATLDNSTAQTALLLAQANVNAVQVALNRLTNAPRQVDLNVDKAALNLANAQLKAASGSVDHLQQQIAALSVNGAKDALWLQETQRDQDQKAKNDLLNGATTLKGPARAAQVNQANAIPSNIDENTALDQKGFDVQVAEANNEAAQQQTGNMAAITSAQSQVVMAQNALDKLVQGPDKQDIARAQINLKIAQSALNTAKVNLGKTVLVAPFDGVVADLNANMGEHVANGPAAVVMDTSHFYVDLPIDEVNISKVTIGQDADVTFTALPGVQLTGKVTRISGSGQKMGGVVAYTVRVEIDPSNQPLLASMTTSASIVTGKASAVLVVPNRYIRTDNSTGKTYANVVHGDGSTEQVEIGVGLRNDTVSEIKSGLNAGDVLTLP